MKHLAPLLCLLTACAAPENAVLEVRLDLPLQADATGKELRFARIAVVTSDVSLNLDKPLTLASESFALTKRDADGCNVNLSVVADDPRKDRRLLERGKEQGLRLLVWFCPTASACDSRTAPRWLLDFDQALWPDQRSFFEAAPRGSRCSRWGVPQSTLPALQKGASETADYDFTLRVGRCQVLACLDEASRPAQDVGFCSEDGVHPCE